MGKSHKHLNHINTEFFFIGINIALLNVSFKIIADCNLRKELEQIAHNFLKPSHKMKRKENS